MKCNTLHRKLIFYLEGDLPNHEMEQVKSHLTHCTDCAEFAAEMKKTLALISADKVTEVNPFLVTRIKARMENQRSPEGKRIYRPSFARILQPIAFSLLLFAGVYSGFKIGKPVSRQIPQSSLSSQEMIPYLNEMDFESIETFLME